MPRNSSNIEVGHLQKNYKYKTINIKEETFNNKRKVPGLLPLWKKPGGFEGRLTMMENITESWHL